METATGAYWVFVSDPQSLVSWEDPGQESRCCGEVNDQPIVWR